MCGCLSHTPTGDKAGNPGMCPGWELNWRPFGLQAHAQSTEPHQPGPATIIFDQHVKIINCVPLEKKT